jgi:hypothetical protein
MQEKQHTKLTPSPKDKVANNHQHSKAAKGKPGGPTTEDRMEYGRNLSRAKNQGN